MDEDPVARRLAQAPMEVVGRFADASNATLLVRLTDRDPRPLSELAEELGHEPGLDDLDPADLAVHKPRQGERPLWDFPTGTLHRREVAAYEVAAALGWDLVPQTVVRDGPYGPGSVQRFVPHDPQMHYFSLVEAGDPGVRRQLVQMVILDLVIDNADRKGGHVLLETGDDGRPGRIRLVDHGVTFNVERKLRTVAWDFAGEPVPADLAADVDRLCGQLTGTLGQRLAALLTDGEVHALRRRIAEVGRMKRLPEPSGPYPYPWPLL